MNFIQDYNMGNSELLVAVLERVENELDRIMWNATQEDYDSPFRNTGNNFLLPTFKVRAYDWNWDEESGEDCPGPNFEWEDFKVWWYKHLGRGLYTNREISNDELNEMLKDCLRALREFEEYTEEHKEDYRVER